MGISDDIRPKKKAVSQVEETETEKPQDEPLQDGEILIPIARDNKIKPVLEDIEVDDTDDTAEDEMPFEHLLNKSGPLPTKIQDTEPTKAKSREDNFRSFTDYHQNNQKKSHTLSIFVIVFVILLGAILVWQNISEIKKLMGISSQTEKNLLEPANTNSGVEVITGQDYTGSESPNTKQETPSVDVLTPGSETTPPATTPAPSTTPTTPAAGSSDISALKVEVLNGNGISGSAQSVKDKLIAAGYNVLRLANALKFTYSTTIIYYNTGKKAEADALASALPERKTEVIEDAVIAGKYDLVVVVGKT